MQNLLPKFWKKLVCTVAMLHLDLDKKKEKVVLIGKPRKRQRNIIYQEL